MRERVKRLGGEFTLRSAPGEGTTVEAAVKDGSGSGERQTSNAKL